MIFSKLAVALSISTVMSVEIGKISQKGKKLLAVKRILGEMTDTGVSVSNLQV